jgi:hypothetical protein
MVEGGAVGRSPCNIHVKSRASSGLFASCLQAIARQWPIRVAARLIGAGTRLRTSRLALAPIPALAPACPASRCAPGRFCDAIVFSIDTEQRLLSLIMFQDTGVTGLPLTPNGSDVQINVNAAGWFILCAIAQPFRSLAICSHNLSHEPT